MSAENLPRKFGKYTLIRHLATGGMAEIYLAIHRSIQGFEKLVVIKQILPRFSEDEEFIRMFLAEARIAATLNHPNVIQIFDVGSVGRDYFIAMEYVHGEDLRSIVGAMRGKGFKEFPIEMALGVIRGVCNGLAYAHAHKGLDGEPLNIVHRDISPQNILITFPGEVKIVDFGIARAAMRDMKAEAEKSALRGKFPYMSPEQCRGTPLDRRSDIFSVAIVLYEITVGRRLFKGKTEIETIRRIVELPYPKPTDARPAYPPDLEKIVMKGLSRDRDLRYRDAAEMQEDIEEYIRNHQIKVSNLEMARFMESLFEEKLAAEREQMKEGKKLADIIAAEEKKAREEEEVLDFGNLPGSGATPAGTSMTLSGITQMTAAPKKRVSPILFVIIGVLLLALGGAGAFVGVSAMKAKREAAQRIGVVAIASDPADAAVWLDGARQEGDTPIEIGKLQVGIEYVVKVTKEGYEPFEKKVSISREEPRVEVKAVLTAMQAIGDGVLKLLVKPADATIILDGKKLDERGSATLTGMKPGVPHTLLVQADEWADWTDTIRLKAGEVKELSIALNPKPIGPDEFLLSVVTDPAGASVAVDGKAVLGVTPLNKRFPWKKSVEVVVDLAKHKKETQTIAPEAGKPLEVKFSLAKKKTDGGGGDQGGDQGTAAGSGPGKLVLDAEPWANVNIPGVGKFVTPFSTSLPAGTYKVTLTNPSGLSKTISIKIGAGETVRKKVPLQ